MHCQALLRHCLRVGTVAQERRPDEQPYWIIRLVIGFLQRFALRSNSSFIPSSSKWGDDAHRQHRITITVASLHHHCTVSEASHRNWALYRLKRYCHCTITDCTVTVRHSR